MWGVLPLSLVLLCHSSSRQRRRIDSGYMLCVTPMYGYVGIHTHAPATRHTNGILSYSSGNENTHSNRRQTDEWDNVYPIRLAVAQPTATDIEDDRRRTIDRN